MRRRRGDPEKKQKGSAASADSDGEPTATATATRASGGTRRTAAAGLAWQEALLWVLVTIILVIGAVAVDRRLNKRVATKASAQCDQQLKGGQAEATFRAESYRFRPGLGSDARGEGEREALPKFGRVSMQWQTPVYHLNIRSFLKSKAGDLNGRLGALVLQHFNAFGAENTGACVSGHDRHGVNQLFYEWQTNGAWKQFFRPNKDVQELLKFLHFAVDIYLEAAGVDRLVIETRKREADAWATVHRDCIHHLAHIHEGELVSGVYYVKVPENAGPLIFHDPRGLLPPFGDSFTVHPKAGDLVLFPSWLVHLVGPTAGADERVSIAFNMPGDWQTLTGVSNSFPMELAK